MNGRGMHCNNYVLNIKRGVQIQETIKAQLMLIFSRGFLVKSKNKPLMQQDAKQQAGNVPKKKSIKEKVTLR